MGDDNSDPIYNNIIIYYNIVLLYTYILKLSCLLLRSETENKWLTEVTDWLR